MILKCNRNECIDLMEYLFKVAQPNGEVTDTQIAWEVAKLALALLEEYSSDTARYWLCGSNAFLGTRPIDAIALHQFEEVHGAISAEAAGSYA